LEKGATVPVRTVMLWNYLPVRVTGLLIAGTAVLAGPGSHGGASCWQTVPGPAVPAATVAT